MRGAPRELRRVYRIVPVIREAANQLSQPEDRDGRAYFFFLLYWMLRKLQLLETGLPHVNAAIALHSAAEICERFETWRPT